MIPLHLIKVFSDPAFLDHLNSDPEIRELEAAKSDPVDELAALCQVLGGKYRISPAEKTRKRGLFRRKNRGVCILPITPAVWSIWYCLDLPFVKGSRAATELDADIALFTLSRPANEISGSAWSIALQASGFCKKHDLDYRDVIEVIAILAHDALRPLELLPAASGSESDPEFGADWLTRITGTVAETMNYPAHLIALDRPLAEVALHYCWKLSAADSKLDIRRKQPADICNMIWERTLALAENWRANYGS